MTLLYIVMATLWSGTQSSCQVGIADFLTIISWLFFCSTFSEGEKYKKTSAYIDLRNYLLHKKRYFDKKHILMRSL